jgi:hypothetical protein
MNENDRARFRRLAERNKDLAALAANLELRAVHQAWARFYLRLCGGAAA